MPSVAILVPVIGRPHHAAPFMQSFRTSGADATVYAIAEHDDLPTIEAWLDAGADVAVTPDCRTFAEKINFGYQITQEDWIFLVGDDVWFHPGWLEAALTSPGSPKVIGVRDTDEPKESQRVGHLLIKRSYVDELGASWDGPGIVCHPYHHNYVDDEIITVAQRRGTYFYCTDGYVEHLHPNMGKAPTDEIYQRSWDTAQVDYETWLKRWAEHTEVAQ